VNATTVVWTIHPADYLREPGAVQIQISHEYLPRSNNRFGKNHLVALRRRIIDTPATNEFLRARSQFERTSSSIATHRKFIAFMGRRWREIQRRGPFYALFLIVSFVRLELRFLRPELLGQESLNSSRNMILQGVCSGPCGETTGRIG
jgi:hypothetical protein